MLTKIGNTLTTITETNTYRYSDWHYEILNQKQAKGFANSA